MSTFRTLSRSKVITGLQWLSEAIPYPEADIKGDTFPMTWADDGEIYTSAGDPLWPSESRSGLDVQKFSGGPTDYKIAKVNPMLDYVGWGGDGPKPTGMICVDGILYLAFQNLLRARKPPFGLISQHGSDAHIIYSTDKGGIWKPSYATLGAPMFPGHLFGGPAFINFGQNNAGARDNFVYAISSDQWDNGSNLRLGCGIAPVREMLDRGLAVGLGTDGSVCADNQNLFEALRIASVISTIRFPHQTARWLDADTVWDLATRGSARVLGQADDLGAVAPRRKADLVLLRADSIFLRPLADPVKALVYAETGAAIDTVIVDGRVVVERGREAVCSDLESDPESEWIVLKLLRLADQTQQATPLKIHLSSRKRSGGMRQARNGVNARSSKAKTSAPRKSSSVVSLKSGGKLIKHLRAVRRNVNTCHSRQTREMAGAICQKGDLPCRE